MNTTTRLGNRREGDPLAPTAFPVTLPDGASREASVRPRAAACMPCGSGVRRVACGLRSRVEAWVAVAGRLGAPLCCLRWSRPLYAGSFSELPEVLPVSVF